VQEFYAQMIASGGHRFELDLRRIVVDHDAVVTEGSMFQRLPGSALAAAGIQQVEGEPVDVDASYRA